MAPGRTTPEIRFFCLIAWKLHFEDFTDSPRHFLICDICHGMWELVRKVWRHTGRVSTTHKSDIGHRCCRARLNASLATTLTSRVTRRLSHHVLRFEALKCTHSCPSQEHVRHSSHTPWLSHVLQIWFAVLIINIPFSIFSHFWWYRCQIFTFRKDWQVLSGFWEDM